MMRRLVVSSILFFAKEEFVSRANSGTVGDLLDVGSD